MKLFLTSSCISENLREDFLRSFGKDPRKSKCYFIPTASDPDEEKFYTCKSMDDLSELGFNPIWYALKYKTKEMIENELSDADIIWVGGGNTFYLLDIARRSGFLEVITDLVKHKDIAYAGVSAGTLLASSSIISAAWEPNPDPNDIGIEDLSALGFVKFTPVVHYVHERLDSIEAQKGDVEEVYIIPDGGMIVVNEDEIGLFGGAAKHLG